MEERWKIERIDFSPFCPKTLVTECTEDGDGTRRCFQFVGNTCRSFETRQRQGKSSQHGYDYEVYQKPIIKQQVSYYLVITEAELIEKNAVDFSNIFCELFELLKVFANRGKPMAEKFPQLINLLQKLEVHKFIH